MPKGDEHMLSVRACLGPVRELVGFRALRHVLLFLFLFPAILPAKPINPFAASGIDIDQVMQLDEEAVNILNGNVVLGMKLGSEIPINMHWSFQLSAFYNLNMWSFTEKRMKNGCSWV